VNILTLLRLLVYVELLHSQTLIYDSHVRRGRYHRLDDLNQIEDVGEKWLHLAV
jgi:hypothetical protein